MSPSPASWWGSRRRDDGSAVVEIVILVPVLVVFLLFVVALGRMEEARGDVDGAARDAARAASLRRDASSAQADAQQAAMATLSTRKVTCQSVAVDVDLSAFRPSGVAAADVTCWVRLSDLTGLSLPGTRAVHAHAVAPIDAFEGMTSP